MFVDSGNMAPYLELPYIRTELISPHYTKSYLIPVMKETTHGLALIHGERSPHYFFIKGSLGVNTNARYSNNLRQ